MSKIHIVTSMEGLAHLIMHQGDVVQFSPPLNVIATADGEHVAATLEQPERPKRKPRKHTHGG